MKLAAALLLLCGCHAFYQVRGTVRRCDDQQPIAGAQVTLTYPGERGAAKTEADGSFVVAANDPPGDNVADLVVEAPGLEPVTRQVRHGESVDVCLR